MLLSEDALVDFVLRGGAGAELLHGVVEVFFLGRVLDSLAGVTVFRYLSYAPRA